jgi:hypothetical protein
VPSEASEDGRATPLISGEGEESYPDNCLSRSTKITVIVLKFFYNKNSRAFVDFIFELSKKFL